MHSNTDPYSGAHAKVIFDLALVPSTMLSGGYVDYRILDFCLSYYRTCIQLTDALVEAKVPNNGVNVASTKKRDHRHRRLTFAHYD